MSDHTPVFYESILVGTIHTDASGSRFTYDESWLNLTNSFRISLAMPLGIQQVPHEVIIPWLMNLLPEGDAAQTMGRRFGIASGDILGLLGKVGRDTAGALSIGQPRSRHGAEFIPIHGQSAFEKIIEDLPKKPFLAGENGVSMSLAGAQEKLPVAFQGSEIVLPINGAPSTHIIKPDNPRLPGIVQNEALCMVLARRMGLETASVTTGQAGARSYLLVERYDRLLRNGVWRRLHQEDFCQALSLPPAAKYQHNRSGIPGPGLVDLFRIVRIHMTARDTIRLLDAVIFNVLATNVDSHAKNYSIMLTGRPQMAPLYDLVAGDVWPEITQNLPQDIDRKNRGRHINRRHWRRMAEECGLSANSVVRRVNEMAKALPTLLDKAVDEVRAMPAGDHFILREVAEAIRRRCATVISNMHIEDDVRPVPDTAGQTMDDMAPPSP
ncbi:type II toxin-antitoxin system HipA family toxin [Acidiphilium sp. C61]|uniref:type II toxin-antitoxin system HipA family toxin n=1 Tax=Acidiphilium sp. C61 TaxID=1671485 RepID=UPI00157ACA57|nr:type II toxin-antitoxin system HipA family toxin [Acidiphilium sp. C61]